MKKKSLMRSIAAAPHVFWAILFIVLPLLIVLYYAFTDSDGAFTLENIASLSEYGPIFTLSVELSIIATFVCVDGGFAENEAVDVVIRPEDVDVVAPEKGMLTGKVTSVTFKGVHYEIIVDIRGFKWMIQSTDYVSPDANIGLYIEPDAIHIMKKSKYSGKFGDYSSFSDEIDQLSDADSAEEF